MKALRVLEIPVESRWTKLTELCRRLEQLAKKQRNGEEFDADDNEFISEYGNDLAALLLYESHAGTKPFDDALRAVAILTHQQVRSAETVHFHVAVGRPRAIYVLYPFQGKEVLCRGAVLPYYEYTHASPLTDDEWKSLHDSPNRPPPPVWLSNQ